MEPGTYKCCFSVAATIIIVIVTITEKVEPWKHLKESMVNIFISLGVEKTFLIMTQKPNPIKEKLERFELETSMYEERVTSDQ